LERVLINLASWFPHEHFGGTGAVEYFSKFIADRYAWRSALHEPEGPGTVETLARVLIGGDVLDDVADAIADIVGTLSCASHTPAGFVGRREHVTW
jgi:hypothetical protein